MPSAQGRTYKGSQKWLQIVVNECPHLLNCAISSELPDSPADIDWRSPLAEEEYSLGIPKIHALSNFVLPVFIDAKDIEASR